MKYNDNVIKSVWRRVRKPSRATLDVIHSQNAQKNPAYHAGREIKREAQTLDSAVWQHMTRLEADCHKFLTTAKAVVRLRDMNVHSRPKSEMVHALCET